MINLTRIEKETFVWYTKESDHNMIKDMFKTPGALLLAYTEKRIMPAYQVVGERYRDAEEDIMDMGHSVIEYDPTIGSITYLGIPDQESVNI